MKIRVVKREDVRAIVQVEMSSGYHRIKFDFEPCILELFEKGHRIFCAEENGFFVGYSSLSDCGEIGFLAVSKKYRGRGIASLLLKRVFSFAKRKKIKRLFLDVRKDNLPAIGLYQKNNFGITKSYRKKIDGKGILKLRMEKKL